ncbi:MAG TPA: hypothetical protein VFG53_08010 [Anaeromyxobacter sp.]|nr:hypothetical protein [Anaeromyxobacter sp.]
MILLEFAAQGVRGVAPAGGRATLRPGYNVLSADGAALRRLLEALFYPDPRDGEALPRPSGAAASVSLRAGLTLVGNDRVTYRLVRDFKGAAQLHRFDPEKRSFALVANDLSEIAAFLQATAGVPPSGRLAALQSLSAAELPSKQGGAGMSAASPLPPARSGLTPEQAAKRVVQLRAELQKAQVAEKLQAELDENQHRAFKVEELLKGGAQAEEGLSKARAARAELDPVSAALSGLGEVEARLASFEKVTARRDEALARVSSERNALDEAEALGAPRPFWQDPRFFGGLVAGALLSLLFGVAGAASSSLRVLMVLAIPAFGFSAYVALRYIGALEDFERRARRRRVVDDWSQKVEAQYARDASDVQAAMKAAGVQNLAELREALGRIADADAVVSEWQKRLSEWEQTPEASGARAERARLEEERVALEARLSAEVGGFLRDVRSIQGEIQRLEAEAVGPAPAPRRPAAPVRAAGEPLRTLLERAAAELGSSPSGAGRSLSVKASQALAGLSFQRLSAVQVDDRGGLHAVVGGRPAPAATLPPADRDLIYLSLKLALLEQSLQGTKTLAVVDDAFASLSDGSRRFAARLLKQIARGAQVLHATGDAVFREAADHNA